MAERDTGQTMVAMDERRTPSKSGARRRRKVAGIWLLLLWTIVLVYVGIVGWNAYHIASGDGFGDWQATLRGLLRLPISPASAGSGDLPNFSVAGVVLLLLIGSLWALIVRSPKRAVTPPAVAADTPAPPLPTMSAPTATPDVDQTEPARPSDTDSGWDVVIRGRGTQVPAQGAMEADALATGQPPRQNRYDDVPELEAPGATLVDDAPESPLERVGTQPEPAPAGETIVAVASGAPSEEGSTDQVAEGPAPTSTIEDSSALKAEGFVPRVFISHSSADNVFGLKLAAELEAELGPDSVWYDQFGNPDTYFESGLGAGDKWQERIEREETTRDVFVVIISPVAMDSPWVRTEIRLAIDQEIGRGKVLVPVLHLPTENIFPLLRVYQYVSFLPSEPYVTAFANLLAAVRAGQTRRNETEQPLGERLGPPYDISLLPQLDHFVGREENVTWAVQQLTAGPSASTGLASIAAANGLGGIGKSALAAAVMRRLFVEGYFADGLAVVRCNELRDPATVLRRALERFGARGKEVEEADLPSLGDIAQTVFEDKMALVVLDNVEDGWPVEEVVKPLRTAGVALLLTSRKQPNSAAVPHEANMQLELLTPEQAQELFAQSYGRPAWQDLSIEEQAGARRILKALGYHTLAVKLAAVYAARRRGRTLDSLADGYVRNPRLALGLKDGSEAVGAVLDTSLAAVSAKAQALFAALAAFGTADVGRNAVLSIAELMDERHAQENVDALEDMRLLEPYISAEMGGEGDHERLRIHPLVRSYAEEVFNDGKYGWGEGDRQDAYRAIANYYAGYANRTDDALLGPDEENIVYALDKAIARGDDDAMADIVNGMQGYWEVRSRTDARERYLPLAVAAAERVAQETKKRDDNLRLGRLQLAYATLQHMRGYLDEADELTRKSLAIRLKNDDRRGEGVALSLLGDIALRRGDPAGAEGSYRDYLAIMREVGDRREEGVALSLLGDIALRRGDLAGAEGSYRDYLAIMREVGDRRGEGVALSKLGDIALRRGDLAGAEGSYREVLAIMHEVGDRRGEGVALYKLAQVVEATGKLTEAEALHRESLEIAYAIKAPQDIADSLAELGRFLVMRGRGRDEGCRMLNEAISVYVRYGLPGEEKARATARALGCPDDSAES